jgi:16S rRNA (uracil1498-N3)-methyltransferase
MRYKAGDKILIGNNKKVFLAKINEITKSYVTYEIIEEKIGNTELPVFISIYQGYPKGDKLDDIIKHSTELGVSEIIPTLMKRSVFKLEEKKKDSKLTRFRKIAKEAAEQSERLIIPKIPDIISLKQIDFSKYDYKILCYEENARNNELKAFKNIIKQLKENDKVAIVIGPEGGIDETELNYLLSQGFIPASLGPRILRTETAPLYALSAISYELELKND